MKAVLVGGAPLMEPDIAGLQEPFDFSWKILS